MTDGWLFYIFWAFIFAASAAILILSAWRAASIRPALSYDEHYVYPHRTLRWFRSGAVALNDVVHIEFGSLKDFRETNTLERIARSSNWIFAVYDPDKRAVLRIHYEDVNGKRRLVGVGAPMVAGGTLRLGRFSHHLSRHWKRQSGNGEKLDLSAEYWTPSHKSGRMRGQRL